MWDGINTKVLVAGSIGTTIKILQCDDDRGRPYLAASCNRCASMTYVVYDKKPGNEGSEWKCYTCSAEYARPNVLLSSVVHLPPEKSEAQVEKWIADWLCISEDVVRVEVEY